MDLWREEKLPPQRKMPMEAAPMASMGPQVSGQSLTLGMTFILQHFALNVFCTVSFRQPIDLLERDPDLIYVKEEAFDDFPIAPQIRLTDNRKSKSRG